MTALTACAGGIVFDAAHRLLVVRRARPPGAGLWSVPGGRCRPGEAPADACVREVAEETGLAVVVRRHAGQVVRGAYRIDDYVCEVAGGRLRAGDDAAEARWVTRAELAGLSLVPQLWETLAGWAALPG